MRVRDIALSALVLSALFHFPLTETNATAVNPVNISAIAFKSVTGSVLAGPLLGQETILSWTIANNKDELLTFNVIYDIRNEDNISTHIMSEEGSLGARQSDVFQTSWKPGDEGAFTLRQFLITDETTTPQILSPVFSESFIVAKFQPAITPTIDDKADAIDNTTETPAVEVEEEKIRAAYTFLVYMVASDLESQDYAATRDIEEMIDADFGSDVNVVVQTGGSANSTIDAERFIDFTKVQRHEIVDNDVKTVMDLGQMNMGDPRTLRDFITWSIPEYPAENYAIILWDHGNGIRGFGMDDIFGDYLTIREMEEAFSQGKQETGEVFEFIGFDACLMATYEVALWLGPFAHYLVSSEEVEPGWGWDYKSILSSVESTLTSSGSPDGKTIGKIIADSYMTHSKANAALYDNYEADRSVTLSVIDLSKVNRVKDTVEVLGEFLSNHIIKLEQAQNFAKTMQYTERYGIDYDGSAGYADLYQLAENLALSFPGMKPLADSLRSSVQEAVVYNIRGDAKPNANGMSIFMQLDEYQPGEEHLFYLESEWLAVIETSAKKLESDEEAPTGWLEYSSGTLEGQANDDDVSYGFLSFYKELEGSLYEVISYYYLDPSKFLDKTGIVEYKLNEGVISLCEGDTCTPAFVYLEDNGDTQFAYFPVRLESTDYDKRLTLIYEVVGSDFIFIGGWEGVEDGTAQRGLIPLQDGDKIYTYTYQYDQEDSDYFVEIESEPIEVTDNFRPGYHEYEEQFTFEMAFCDFADNCAYSEVFEVS